MNRNQQTFFAVADHSNQGKEFEQNLEATHDWYRLQKWADVRKIPNSWAFISHNEYVKLLRKLPPAHLAKTESGRFMQRVKSDVDFIGGGERFSIAFDAKTCSGNTFPLRNIEPHQLHKLRERAQCRMIAGALIWMTASDRVFFASYKYLDHRMLLLARQHGRRAAPGTASLSIGDLEAHTTEVKKHKTNMSWDWLSVLVK